MAKPSFILQGIRKDNDHESALKEMMSLTDINQIIFSVAFVRENGVLQISDILKKHARHTLVYAGIRNGVTSAQGLLALLNLKVKLYAVDTGLSSIIFHPKVYLSLNNSTACVIIGSANLTNAGLNGNIEASTILKLNREDGNDKAFLDDLISSITTLQTKHPAHVFQITKKRDIAALLKEGRLEDERFLPPPRPTAFSSSNKRDRLGRIKLFRKQRPEKLIRPPSRKKIKIASDKWILIWVSKGLTERDLNIPTGTNTNPTGSMLLKKGRMEDIDQRHYFRDVVFANIAWAADKQTGLSQLERAQADFEINVKGINYGIFTLKLTHNNRTDTRAYEQKNAMTQIHWGNAKNIIAQRDLLDRELRLYRKDGKAAQFVIEID